MKPKNVLKPKILGLNKWKRISTHVKSILMMKKSKPLVNIK